MPDSNDSSTSFYPTPIDLKEVKKNALSVHQIGNDAHPMDVVVLVDGEDYRIVRDLCPHMGAPLSQGKACAKEATLHCPWHGYEFDLKTGELKHNPNDETFACLKPLYKTFNPGKTPKYRLRVLQYEIRDEKLFVRRGASS